MSKKFLKFPTNSSMNNDVQKLQSDSKENEANKLNLLLVKKTLLECWTAISKWYEKPEGNPANFEMCFNLIMSMFNVGVGQSKWTKLFDQEKLTICPNKFGFNNSKLNILHPVVSRSRGYLESLQSIKLVMWIST